MNNLSGKNRTAVAGMIFVIWIFLVLGCLCSNNASRENKNKPTTSSLPLLAESPNPTINPPSNPSATPMPADNPTTPAELLAAAQKLLNRPNSDKFDKDTAYRFLRAIPENAEEHKEAQKLLKGKKDEPNEAYTNYKKVYQEGYKIGFAGGRNRPRIVTPDTEVKNKAQVSILADAAAEFVYKPKDETAWKAGWIDGFIDGYNKVRPDNPIDKNRLY